MTKKEQKAYDEALHRIQACLQQGKEGTRLDLSDLGLTTLPPEIGQLTALTVLDLRNNQLSVLSHGMGGVCFVKKRMERGGWVSRATRFPLAIARGFAWMGAVPTCIHD